MATRHPTAICRVWQFDSRRWAAYVARPGDIVIATYPKSGTTWMQRIVSLLVFQNTEPRPVMEMSVWPDANLRPLDAVVKALDQQTHRRFLKAHLPYDALPIHDHVRYIHVARDGRDAALSYHRHLLGLRDEIIARFDAVGRTDETLARPFPRTPEDPGDYFHRWITEGVDPDAADGMPLPSYFAFEQSWWQARDQENVLLVHFADLKADLDGEMRRIAAFLEIETPEALWPTLVETAGFSAMQKEGAGLLGKMGDMIFRDGGASFIHQGTGGRWRDVFREDDLSTYEARMNTLPAPCAQWLRAGRHAGLAQ